MTKQKLLLIAGLLSESLLAAASSPVQLTPVVVTASRAAQTVDEVPLLIDVIGASQLQDAPALVLDDALRSVAAFSLFRRSGSLVANPTAQGVSLRNVGPSGASRSLVLLDGVPLNDPFGGWVAWSSVAVGSLDRVEMVHGGGSGAWGNAALSGTVQLFSATPEGRSVGLSSSLGDFGLRRGELGLTESMGRGVLSVGLEAFAFDGFHVIARSQRGSVDRPLDSRHQTARLGWRQAIGTGGTLSVSGRFFREERGNGTPLQKNDSESVQLTAAASGVLSPERSWNVTAYYQEQSFASYFSSVNANRTAETPANDQFDVPATAAGVSFSLASVGDQARTVYGADGRWVEGETRERFLFTGGQFTRLRRAGGEQFFGGIFLNHDRALRDTWRGSFGMRVDTWTNRAGHRRETDSATGAVVRDDHYASARQVEFSPQIGLVWAPASRMRFRGAAYQAFRVPTLNEYYRPFRVGAVTTEANPALGRETLTGAEVGMEAGPANAHFAITVFTNDLRQAVGNVTQTPTLRQRLNLDRVRVDGVELRAEWRPDPAWRLHVDSVLTDARVDRAAVRPSLEGLRLAQTPKATFAAGIDWDAGKNWQGTLAMRHAGRQFEDDDNTLSLAAVTILDLGLTKRLGQHAEISLAIENVEDARIETGRSADGIVTLGPPRLARAGLKLRW